MLTVEDILMIKGPDVILAPESTAVRDAARMMAEANVGSLVVEDSSNSPVGIFTERDLLKRVVAVDKDPGTLTLREAMSTPLKHCSLSDEVSAVLSRMREHHFRHLAVMEAGKLIGMIGLRDAMAGLLGEAKG
ncbi:MAG: cyclic nucleotide-binding/CBS domain-containing protein [Phycisphaerae bacterium]